MNIIALISLLLTIIVVVVSTVATIHDYTGLHIAVRRPVARTVAIAAASIIVDDAIRLLSVFVAYQELAKIRFLTYTLRSQEGKEGNRHNFLRMA